MWGGGTALIIIFFGLTLPLLVEGAQVETKKLIALGGFWVMGVILTLIPLALRLEIGNDSVKFYFLHFCYRNLHNSDIQVLEYGNLMRAGGLGYGKGLKGWEKTSHGGNKYFSIGEQLYGKEALAHAKGVLEIKLNTKKVPDTISLNSYHV